MPYVSLEIDDELKKYRFQYYPPTIQDDDLRNVTEYMQHTKFPTGIHHVLGTRSYGSIFVELANLDIASLLYDLDQEIGKYINNPTNKDDLIYRLEHITKSQYGILHDPLLQIILSKIIKAVEQINQTILLAQSIRESMHHDKTTSNGKLNVEEKIRDAISGLSAYELLGDIKDSCDHCKYYCSLFTNSLDTHSDQMSIELKCNITLSKNSSISMHYTIDDLFTMACLEHFKIVSLNIMIKECENCGKYFIPYTRSDEKYCDNIFKDEKTCKELGYEMKLKKDEFKSAYRKAYKTQHARIRYNRHIPDYEEKHFRTWEKAAKQALAEYTEKNDIEGFEKWLQDNKDAF